VALLAVLSIPGMTSAQHKRAIWQGVLHLGDDPQAHPKVTSAGLAFQVPCKLDANKLAKLTVTAEGVQTQAGKGHIVEVLAHIENQPDKSPAKEILVASFRIKDKTDDDDAYTFEFDPAKNLRGETAAYYSVRIRVDTYIQFSLWEDFLVKRIQVEQ
jgi:hypothetical protein